MALPKSSKIPPLIPAIPGRTSKVALDPAQITAAREYIQNYWPKLTRSHPEDDKTIVGLPNPYLIPSYDEKAPFSYNEQYYWDSYFSVQGMLNQENKDFVAGILENFFVLMDRFHIIPNSSRTYHTGHSQPPFLTSFIFDVYNIGGYSVDWLKEKMAVAEQEYYGVWMSEKHPNWRLVSRGLSRYYDFNVLHDLAEAESGWDMTTRFNRRALNYLPVDLNALLYKYETDFALAAKMTDDLLGEEAWLARAELRKQTMNALMWDKRRQFFYDYNYKKEQIGRVSSLAGYFPMWAGMVSEKQAAHLVRNLKKFEQRGGLATTDTALPGLLSNIPTQWAYPNGWAPLHFIVVEALKRYGYEKDARRIAHKWLSANLAWFSKHKNFLEKYNVVNPYREPVEGLYPSQTGFGWTNAIFERFCQDWL